MIEILGFIRGKPKITTFRWNIVCNPHLPGINMNLKVQVASIQINSDIA